MGASDWTALGHPDIDQEHRALFRIVSEVEAAVQRGAPSDIPVLLEQLASYSEFHFRSEEEAMRAAGFAGLDEHIREHRKFTTRIELLKLQLYRSDLGRELLDFARNWFRAHTLETDEKFAQHLRKKRAATAP